MIEIKPVAELKRGPKCDGCDHNRYSAPFGQPLRPEPHSWCLYFSRAIPMVVDKQGTWYSSEIPAGCPKHKEREYLI